jgi:uncharacterized protein (TIRG00374 family)
VAPDPAPDPPPGDPATAGTAGRRSTRARVWQVTRFVLGVVLGGLAIYAVTGKSDELSGATAYLDHLNWGWAVIAAVAEAASYLAFGSMQRRLLAAGRVRVGVGSMTGVALAGNVLQTSLPGGVVVSAAWTFRKFRRYGADDVLSGWVLVAMTAASMISLAILAAAGLALAASTGSALGLVGVILGLLVVLVVLVGLWHERMWLIRHATRLLGVSQRLINRPRVDPTEAVQEALARVAAISPNRLDWAWAFGWAAANWVFDMSCLVFAFLAVGVDVPWEGLLLAYAGAQLASNLPITPGGLGVVEGSLTVALVAFGGAQASTVAAVLIYRLLSFWLVLPAGFGALATFSIRHRHQDRRAEQAEREARLAAAGRPRPAEAT